MGRLRLTPLGWAKVITIALCVGFGLAFVIANIRSWQLEDAEAYWNAALRLRHGDPLYVAVDPNADELVAYRYAPWVAWLWVPLTMLPKHLVQAGWSALLIAASGLAVWPVLQHRSASAISLAALMGGVLLRTASTGNVHPLLVAALVWTAGRGGGPVVIGAAASAKLTPIAFALTYLGKREWRRLAIAVATGVALTAPMLAYDLSAYPADPGESFSLWSNAGIAAYGGVALATCAAAVALARTRYAWLASSVAVIALTPRLEYYTLTYLLVAAAEAVRRQPVLQPNATSIPASTPFDARYPATAPPGSTVDATDPPR